MKKFLFLGAMAAMLLGTASCSNDMEPQAKDGEALVQYTVTLGDGIDSRTISDGTKANTLKFAVFTEDGQHLDALDQEVPVENKSATITTKLARYHTYKLVFWAQNSECDAYDTSDMSAIKVDYDPVNCNDESRDAFYKMHVQEMGNTPVNENIVLTRPFAQINFLASDAAGVQGLDAYTSKVTVTGVPTQLNTLDGTVAEPTDVTFDYALLPNETLVNYETYKYVAMNYVLAAVDKELKNTVELTINDGSQDVNTVTVNGCPVQRNYRTNIFGDLFTVEGNFNITIDPIYDQPDLPEKTNVVYMDGQEYETIEAAYNAAIAASKTDIVISLAKGTYTMSNDFAFENANKVTNVTVQAANGVNAADITINGRFAMSASSAQKVATGSSMTIKGVTFSTNTAGPTNGDATHYYRSNTTNVYVFGGVALTVEDCIFNIKDNTGEASINTWGDQNTSAVVRNCVFNSETTGKPVAFGNGNYNAVENCTFNQPRKYAVQVNHYGANSPISQLVFKNNIINANPSAKNYGIALDARQEAYYNLNVTVENNVMNDAISGSYLYAHSDNPAIWETVTVNNSRDEWGIYPQ